MKTITKKEFKEYSDFISSDEVKNCLESDSAGNISKLQAKISLYGARLGQCLARHKNEIRDEKLKLMNDISSGKGMAENKADPTAEKMIDDKYEVSRREMDNLREDMKNIGIACGSRIKSLEIEKFSGGNQENAGGEF